MSYQREFTLDITKGNNRFKIIWVAFGFVSPNGNPRNVEMLRREASISKKLRNISIFKEDKELKERELKDGDQKLILEQPEIDLIRQRIESYPYWNPLAEDSPADVYDWLNTGTELSN